MAFEMHALSSLEKVFCDQAPQAEAPEVQGFQNEMLCFQLAYCYGPESEERTPFLRVSVQSEIRVHVRQVKQVPVQRPAYLHTDGDYLRSAPGLYPDLLREITPYNLRAFPGQWQSLWFEVDPDGIAPGAYPIGIRIEDEQGQCLGEYTQTVTILPGHLPPQALIHTKWLHTDCLAQYYHVPVFSEEHWRILEQFIRTAVAGGINMILTPIHTPPLDTRVGGERLTTQLVDVYVEHGRYRFGMEKLRRWIHMCKGCGVQYYEMAHLYTQWGGAHAPKIMGVVKGEARKLFGWETDSTSDAYGAFLQAYIPAIRKVLREEGVEKATWWHISDEPSLEHLPTYLAAKKQVEPLLKGCAIMDALSNYAFYQQGVVDRPVVATDHAQPFLDAKVPHLWLYYCCGQHKGVSNQFIAMPSERNRILGMQLFRCEAEGFLHWGFNFYNSQYSDYPINPYAVTDGDGFAQSGDMFQVYPGENGVPELSIRYMVFREAMQDLRALQWLAQLSGREAALALVEQITLTRWERGGLLALRRRINAAIISAAQARRA